VQSRLIVCVADSRGLLWLFACTAIVLGATGQLLLRYVGRGFSEKIAEIDVAQSGWRQLCVAWTELGNELMVLSLACVCYGVATLTWLRVLQRLPLSRAYPLLALGYLLVYGGAIAWLGETPSWNRTLGTGLVAMGVLLAVRPGGTGEGIRSQ